MNTAVHFSSKSNDWETPPEIVELAVDTCRLYLDYPAPFEFDLDVCAGTREVAKAPKYYSKWSLQKKWVGRCWMNPPYGRKLREWVQKALEESQQPYNECVMCLLPARTDTVMFHKECVQGTVFFIPGRVRFMVGGEQGDAAPFPSMLVLFSKMKEPGDIVRITDRWKLPKGK